MATDPRTLTVNTIRGLAMDAVQKANAGHPGTAMALAPLAYLLYRDVMSHNPADPAWANRDRFVLSAGHACILQYAALHLAGYDVSLSQNSALRASGSICNDDIGGVCATGSNVNGQIPATVANQIGLNNFEGRSYVSLKRHLALCLVAMAFVAIHTTRLRGEKPGGDPGTSMPGPGVGVPAIPGSAARDR